MKWLLPPACAVVLGAALAACSGCRSTSSKPEEASTAANANGNGAADPGPPTVRLYVVSDPSGALEPCGCVKDQLGGIDHLASYVHGETLHAPAAAMISAGPLFFLDPTLKEDHRAQDLVKAQTLAESFSLLGLAAFAPGQNDWAAGPPELEKLRIASGGALVCANVTEDGAGPGFGQPVIKEISGVKIGLFGVSTPDKGVGAPPAGVTTSTPPEESAKAQAASLKAQGAQVLVALAAVGRGTAKRIADLVPDLTAVVVGSSGGAGESNTDAPPAERLGNVLVLETSNHLQTVAVLDLYVRDGSTTFADASGLQQERRRADLVRRIDELRGRIGQWETDKKVAAADVEARKADLAQLERELASVQKPPPPASGSFFRYKVVEVRDSLGKDPAVSAKIAAYYKQVDDMNKVAFADKKPPPPPAGAPAYIGVESCTTCHDEARAVWDKTRHAHAYASLATQFKEYNLDCVSCHVTGYDQPGGSTVTHVEKLQNVQCEVCHGPGSKHAAKPDKVPMPIAKPKPDQCLACHHPPHVHEFDAQAKMAEILGPGHGQKDAQ